MDVLVICVLVVTVLCIVCTVYFIVSFTYMACPSESGTDTLCKCLFSLNARICYKLKSGT